VGTDVNGRSSAAADTTEGANRNAPTDAIATAMRHPNRRATGLFIAATLVE
jgi:hypothetical protein